MISDDERFGLPADTAARCEWALGVLLRHGKVDAARVFIDEQRDRFPAYGEYLAAKYKSELGS